MPTNMLSNKRSLGIWSLHMEERVVVGLDRDYLIKHLRHFVLNYVGF
ncbi:hypothetical protein Hdeb2414_s0013g00411191 [Helianthus debilis subsp. tardiflorus]